MSQYEGSATIPILKVLVIESRPLSLALADDLGVRHASPQMILVRDGKPIWSTSHYDITDKTLREQEQLAVEQ